MWSIGDGMENRIEINPRVMAGKPVIKGYKSKDIIKEYPSLKEKDIVAAIEYASGILKREEVVEAEA